MREKIIAILDDIDEDIVLFDGDNLVEEGIIDSFTIAVIIERIDSELGVSIPVSCIVEDNFKTAEAIINMIESIN